MAEKTFDLSELDSSDLEHLEREIAAERKRRIYARKKELWGNMFKSMQRYLEEFGEIEITCAPGTDCCKLKFDKIKNTAPGTIFKLGDD